MDLHKKTADTSGNVTEFPVRRHPGVIDIDAQKLDTWVRSALPRRGRKVPPVGPQKVRSTILIYAFLVFSAISFYLFTRMISVQAEMNTPTAELSYDELLRLGTDVAKSSSYFAFGSAFSAGLAFVFLATALILPAFNQRR